MAGRGRGAGYQIASGANKGRWAVRSGGKVYYGTSQGEARRKAQAAAGAIVLTASGTLGSYLDDWLASTKNSLAPQTWTSYAGHLRHHVQPHIGNVLLANIKESDIERLQAVLTTGNGHRELSGTTRRSVHVILGTALEAARRRGLITVNPVKNVRAPKLTIKEATPLTVEQAKALLVAAHGTKYESLFVLSLTTGVRPGELMGLHWRDLDGATLRIRGNAVTGHGGARLVGPTKTKRSNRTITLTPMAVEALALYRSEQPSTAPDALIYPGPAGGVLAASTLSRQYFRPLVKAAGLPATTTLYSLRHTFATTALNNGVPLHIVSAILGHSNPTVTLNTYSHFVKGGDAAAAAITQSLYQ
jgi:integrase